ncbi:hypothetical protein J1N35_014012 [Gossypium stocksii]|uniref:Uncharacterized protein n=1 Tax=Gossypium stocksii TaxID=47602 RepID=A0A9D3VUW9_9ROSI|nr:hypothetical protein J1N35_014012 [Gossypium stocksii]
MYAKGVFGPINIEIDVVVDVKVDLTPNMELNQILNESVEEPIHSLGKIKEVPTKEVDEFISSFDDGDKARVTKASRDIEILGSDRTEQLKKHDTGLDRATSCPNVVTSKTTCHIATLKG